ASRARAQPMPNECGTAKATGEGLIGPKGRWPAPPEPAMEDPPHPMRLGSSERDYYLLGAAGVASREAGNAEDTPEGTLSQPSAGEMAAAGEAPDPHGGGGRAGGRGGAGTGGRPPRPPPT